MQKYNFHDAEIRSVAHKKKQNELTIGLVTENEQSYTLIFSDVKGWELTPFDEQNSLFDFKSYDWTTLTDYVIDNHEVHKYYVDLVKLQEYILYEFDSSVGMGGFVVAKSLEVINWSVS